MTMSAQATMRNLSACRRNGGRCTVCAALPQPMIPMLMGSPTTMGIMAEGVREGKDAEGLKL